MTAKRLKKRLVGPRRGRHSGGRRVEPEQRPLFIVGIGASAGGLEAVAALLKNVKADSMAFVVVQHLAPTHESILPTLLARTSPIAVEAAADGLKVEPNHVYVIPPNTDLAILQGVLHLTTPPPRPPRMPIDYFFRSLAADQGAHAIGIVLSGTGTDGTFGLTAIKESGGITIAQDPMTAKYDGMPRSAIDAGCVDAILAPAAVAEQLSSIRAHQSLVRKPKTTSVRGQEGMAQLLLLIRTTFGHDVSYHKPIALERRVERRLALHRIEKLRDYVKLVEGSPDELRALYKDILITVTSFFRDGEPFDALRDTIFPRIIEEKKPGTTIRMWVPACSTGEEAYSVAICLLEALKDRAHEYRIQLFATDVDDDAIRIARRGRYAENIALDVSPERLQRFFVKKNDEFQVSRRVRDMVVFSNHNITRDAPFSKLDFVSCRNLLIYLQPTMQKRVLRVVHYALNPKGFLMLGTSETVGDAPDLFSLVDQKNKIYASKNVASTLGTDFFKPAPEFPLMPPLRVMRLTNLGALADRKVLELFGPPGVVINEHLEVLHFRGGTAPYLQPSPGTASLNILRLARPELQVELRRTIQRALSENARVTAEACVHGGKKTRPVRLEVIPVADPDTKTRCILVLFHEPALPIAAQASEHQPAATADARRVQELKRELSMTKEYLQSTIEQLETANEELQSSNEELQSSNEELQSTNEELETSRAELQSTNTELTMVNDELQRRMSDQQQTNDDLQNVLAGTDNAVIIVGLNLRIRRFTQAAAKIMNLVPGDVGQSVMQLNRFLGGLRVDDLAVGVIETCQPFNGEVQCANGRSYAVRISPYQTQERAIAGVIVVLVDIDPPPPTRGRDPAERRRGEIRGGLP